MYYIKSQLVEKLVAKSIKVSVKPLQRLAGVTGTASPCRAPQSAKSLFVGGGTHYLANFFEEADDGVDSYTSFISSIFAISLITTVKGTPLGILR